jgi:hypothetical protein
VILYAKIPVGEGANLVTIAPVFNLRGGNCFSKSSIVSVMSGKIIFANSCAVAIMPPNPNNNTIAKK